MKGGVNIKNYGYQNEYDFVDLFNNKYLNELDSKSQSFLKELFPEIINNDEKIICWKNRNMQKTDIYVKYKKHVKGISLKCGHNNTVHSEPIQEFKRYLEKLQIPLKVIKLYEHYHYGYKRDDEGNLDFEERLSAEEYKSFYQEEIDTFNRYINKTKIIIDMIDRFLIRGNFSDYDIDAFVSGTTNDYDYILKHDLYDLILSKRTIDYTSPHIACLTIGPKARYTSGEAKSPKDRYIVCVRWSFIREDIANFKKGLQRSAGNFPSFFYHNKN